MCSSPICLEKHLVFYHIFYKFFTNFFEFLNFETKFTEIPLPGNYRKRKKYRNFAEISPKFWTLARTNQLPTLFFFTTLPRIHSGLCHSATLWSAQVLIIPFAHSSRELVSDLRRASVEVWGVWNEEWRRGSVPPSVWLCLCLVHPLSSLSLTLHTLHTMWQQTRMSVGAKGELTLWPPTWPILLYILDDCHGLFSRVT